MARLSPCPSCTRHVRVGETTCPFCAASVPALVPSRALPRPTSRAALLFAGAAAVGVAAAAGACSSTSGTGPDKDAEVTDHLDLGDSVVAAYGAPFDAGQADAVAKDSGGPGLDAASDAPSLGDSVVAAYGAPFDASFDAAPLEAASDAPSADAAMDSTIVAAYGGPGH